ncbi:MAG: hypothetical protein WC959_04930 [Kiritimatiellales bacterium]
MKYRPKHIAEYIAVRAALAVINILPLRAALALGWLASVLFFYVFRFRTAKAVARLEEVFGDRFSPRERRRIARLSFRNLCFNAVESARFYKLTPKKLKRMPFYQSIEDFHREHKNSGPLILVTAHMGNWDLAGVGCRLAGMPIFSIARRQKNPLTDKLLNNMRNATGMEVILNDSRVLQNVVRKLKAGGVLAILPDVRSQTEALTIDFLGGKANLGAGAALFAQLANCPVYTAILIRHGWTRHEAKVFDPITPDPALDRHADRQRIMQTVMTHITEEVFKHPEQYFWFNKRWVMDPFTKK